MRLLITRAEPGASASAGRLRGLGHDVMVESMLRIEFLPPPAMPDPVALAITSANAVRAVVRWPQASRWADLPVFAVGDATAEAARAAGFIDVRSAEGGIDELGALIGRTLDPAAGPILNPAAETPASDLAGALSAAGFTVQKVVAYRAIPSARLGEEAHRALASENLDAILFYSERGAATFAALMTHARLTQALERLDFLTLSEAVARPLGTLSPRRLKVAARPDEDSLFEMLTNRS